MIGNLKATTLLVREMTFTPRDVVYRETNHAREVGHYLKKNEVSIVPATGRPFPVAIVPAVAIAQPIQGGVIYQTMPGYCNMQAER